MTDVMESNREDIHRLVLAARRLPTELRAELRTRVAREVVAPVAKQVQLTAGQSAYKPVRAFRNRGVMVDPGEEPALRVGGPERYGRTTMRSIAYGAEFGGTRYKVRYERKGRRTNTRGRKRGATHSVRRATTVEFGPHTGKDGRFVFPTMRRELTHMADTYARILSDAATRAGWK